jgi:hypothetical protein
MNGLKIDAALQQTVFVMCYFFDFGLYFPKASLVAFYWWLIPLGFHRLRITVYFSAGFVGCCFIGTLLTDTLIAPNISDNWYVDDDNPGNVTILTDSF